MIMYSFSYVTYIIHNSNCNIWINTTLILLYNSFSASLFYTQRGSASKFDCFGCLFLMKLKLTHKRGTGTITAYHVLVNIWWKKMSSEFVEQEYQRSWYFIFLFLHLHHFLDNIIRSISKVYILYGIWKCFWPLYCLNE